MKKIALISRTSEKTGLEECLEFLKDFKADKRISKLYISTDIQPTDIQDKNYLKNLELETDKIKIVPIDSKYSSTKVRALNMLLKEIVKTDEEKTDKENEIDAVFSVSKEVLIKPAKLSLLIDKLTDYTLVVGYKLHLKNKDYDDELNDYYKRKGIAYLIPWNTCCLWNFKYIKDYINHNDENFFDEICENNSLGELKVNIDGSDKATPYQGMEEGITIARSFSAETKLRSELLKSDLIWDVRDSNIPKHKVKLARKDIVLSTLMNVRGYCPEILRKRCIVEE